MATEATKPTTEYIPAPVSPAVQRERDTKGTLIKIKLADAVRGICEIEDLPFPVEYSGKTTGYVWYYNPKAHKREKKWVCETFGRTFLNKEDLLEYLTAEHMSDQMLSDVRLIKGRLYIESSNKGILASNDYFRMQIVGLPDLHEDKVLTRKQAKAYMKRLYKEGKLDGTKLAAPLPKLENKVTKR